ncbi:MAG: lipopolysaccharide transport system ATP-binding protein [Acidobacteriota bacterium]
MATSTESPAIRFDRVSKRYRVFRQSENGSSHHSLVRRLLRASGATTDFWAVKDVSFTVARGEALGIIGHNGAGKSTILKLLYNITRPTRGEITIAGRLAALIEVASGFHPDLTGRENVYLNGSLLGMRRAEITKKLPSIVEFAGVAPFIDTPVKRYSSGMYLRLGFAIAAHLDSDVLLLDEVLAVGDANFQAKCIGRVTELKRAQKTIVFVSHNLSAVESLCDRALLLHQGQIIASGAPKEVIAEYEQLRLAQPPSNPTVLAQDSGPRPDVIKTISFLDTDGQKTMTFSTGNPFRVTIEFVAQTRLEDVVVEVYFYSVFGNLHTHFSTESGGGRELNFEPGSVMVEFSCTEISLGEAAYNVEVSIKHRSAAFNEYIDYKHAGIINVARGKPVHGVFHTPHTWTMRMN